MFGKRELAHLNPFDLVLLLMLSNTVQNAIIGEDYSLSGGPVGGVDPRAMKQEMLKREELVQVIHRQKTLPGWTM